MEGKITKNTVVAAILSLLLYSTAYSTEKKYDSFLPGQLWLDNNDVHINAHGGGVLFYDNTYYWFGEHKVRGPRGNTARVGVHCYSSQDLYNWKDRGIVLAVSKDPNSPIVEGCIIERPKVIYNKKIKKFVMWFHHELKGRGYNAALSGVAVSDNVAGPYSYLGSFRPNAGIWPLNFQPDKQIKDKTLSGGNLKGVEPNDILVRDFESGQMARDMTLFVDDDGKAYHIYTSEENRTLHISLLTDDYLKPAGKYVRVFENRSMEASTVFKHNGKYYFIGSDCTGWAPNAARSAVADSIWGPWKELGNPCRGTEEQNEITFESQSTYILAVEGKRDSFIFIADRWQPRNPIDGRYIWLPIEWEADKPIIRWYDRWQLTFFDDKDK